MCMVLVRVMLLISMYAMKCTMESLTKIGSTYVNHIFEWICLLRWPSIQLCAHPRNDEMVGLLVGMLFSVSVVDGMMIVAMKQTL